MAQALHKYQPGLIELAPVSEQVPVAQVAQMAAVQLEIDAMAGSISTFNELYFTGDQKKEVIKKVKKLDDELGKLKQQVIPNYNPPTPDWFELSYDDACTLKIKFSLDKGGTYDKCIDGYTDLYDGNEAIQIINTAWAKKDDKTPRHYVAFKESTAEVWTYARRGDVVYNARNTHA